MALLWLEGFEGYGTSTGLAPKPTGILGRKYQIGSESSTDIEIGRFGGYSLEFTSSTPWIRTPPITTNDTIIVGYALYMRNINETNIITLYDDTTSGVSVKLDNGVYVIYRGATEIGRGFLTIGLYKWFYVELKVKCNDTTGTFELRVGGKVIASGSGLDTKAGTDLYYSRVLFGNSSNDSYRIDDIYICDGSGSDNNDFLGDVRVAILQPDGAGNSSDFTPLSGNNYENVDENPSDDDTTYVESSTSTNKDLYTCDNVTSSDIKGIHICTQCRETDGTPFSLITPIRSNSTDYDDSSQAVGGTSYTNLSRIAETDPDTGSAWTDTNLNAAEFGIKVE